LPRRQGSAGAVQFLTGLFIKSRQRRNAGVSGRVLKCITMTVGLEPRRQDEAEVRSRAGGGRRASLQAADFRAAVLDHVVRTCAKELRDASALDFYNAFAHTVRDRLVHRWLATQRTHVEKDVKRVCYFSSEFLTGRSLGLCLMNMDLYDAAV